MNWARIDNMPAQRGSISAISGMRKPSIQRRRFFQVEALRGLASGCIRLTCLPQRRLVSYDQHIRVGRRALFGCLCLARGRGVLRHFRVHHPLLAFRHRLPRVSVPPLPGKAYRAA
jgi:hypothetical protein